MSQRILFAVALVVFAIGCTLGPRLESFTPASSPHGIDVSIRVAGGTVRGELLDVRDTAYVVLQANRIVLVPFVGVSRVEVPDGAPQWHPTAQWPPAEIRDRLRLVSRFPQGLSPELERRFLEVLGQRELEVAR